jgi:hypothetical protein
VRVAASQAARGTVVRRTQGRPPGRGKLAPYVGFPVENGMICSALRPHSKASPRRRHSHVPQCT